jgi:ribosomal protein S12 methylthiotransferase accessory factor YcaO
MGDNWSGALASSVAVAHALGGSNSLREARMARIDQQDAVVTEDQPDLFGAQPAPSYDPDPDKVRARLRGILAEAKAAKFVPWDAARLSLYRTIFPQMANWLPDKEAKRLRREFEKQLARLEAA